MTVSVLILVSLIIDDVELIDIVEQELISKSIGPYSIFASPGIKFIILFWWLLLKKKVWFVYSASVFSFRAFWENFCTENNEDYKM